MNIKQHLKYFNPHQVKHAEFDYGGYRVVCKIERDYFTRTGAEMAQCLLMERWEQWRVAV
jgi:hypothetical protein